MPEFKTHKAHIGQIKGHVKANGPTYFHGDGNIYAINGPDGTRHSDNNKTLTNPAQEEAQYRVRFDTIDQVPGSVDELNDLLLKSKGKEAAAERQAATASGVSTFEAYEEDAESETDGEETGSKSKSKAKK